MSKSKSVVKPLTGIRKYISVKAKKFIEGYNDLMSKRFPKTYRMIQMFTIGTKDFSTDMLQFMRMSKDVSFNPEVSFSSKELMKYKQTQKDIRKMIPFFIVTSIPLSQYVTLPLAFFYPKQILSSHYWTIEQRTRFAIQDHTKRLYNYRPVFRHLQQELATIPNILGNNDENMLYEKCSKVFAKLGSGTHPSVAEILELSPLFSAEPYGIDFLTYSHLMRLCRMYGLNILPGTKIRLKEHIYFIKEVDDAWAREDCNDKNLEDLKRACFIRGLNPTDLNRDEMIHWLNLWINISKNVKEDNLSLLIHSPIFLAYNHPSNWRLIH